MGWLWWIIIGAIAGWLAGKIMRGGGFGLLVNIIVGIVASIGFNWIVPAIVGAIIGGWVFGLLGITTGGVIGTLITALVGAILLLWIISLFRRRT